ncbi:MAG: DMT family transporter [Candidatus Saccharimonadales bacterium]
MKTKQKQWFWIALLAGVFLAPSSLAIKTLSSEFDPFLINTLRFLLAGLLLLPWTIKAMPRLLGKGRSAALTATVLMSVSATCLVLAVHYGPASYVATLQLLGPLLLVWYSRRLIGEKVPKRLLIALAFAAAGASVITLLPVALQQRSDFVFYPLATLFGLLNVLFYPLATVEYRKANENYRIPLSGLIGASAFFVALLNVALWLVMGADVPGKVTATDWAALLYLGIYVSLASKLLNVICYEKVGSALMGAVSYFGSLLAVLLPVVVLSERLALETAIGGCLIVIGLAIAELRLSGHHTRRHIFHHH